MGIHIYEKYIIVFFISLHKNDKLHTQNTHPWNDLNRLLLCIISHKNQVCIIQPVRKLIDIRVFSDQEGLFWAKKE